MPVQLQMRDDVAWVTLDYPSGNAMGLAFLRELASVLNAAQSARALVLTGSGRCFSVGLDLPALLHLSRAEAGVLIREFCAIMSRVFLWPRPTIAAINGHAVAGGFVLASACDFRMAAAGDAKLGMTGVSLGIAYPALVTSLLGYVLPAALRHTVLLEGRLFSVEEAARSGLIDRIASDLAAEVHAWSTALASADARAYAFTKAALKSRVLVEENDDSFLDSVFHPETRGRLEEAVARLRRNDR